MEARGDRLGGSSPLGDEDGVGPLLVQPCADLAPEPRGLAPAGVVLHKRRGHVHAEPRGPALQPVPHDLAHLATDGPGAGRVRRLLPRMAGLRVREAVVEGGLAGEEVRDVAAVALGEAGDRAEPLGRAPHAVRPDEPVGVLVALVAHRVAEPRVLPRGVARDEVEEDPDAALARRRDEPLQVLVRPVARRDAVVVAHVVPGVEEGAVEARVEPDQGDAEGREMVEPPRRARQVADAVAVRVRERLRVDLVCDGVLQPGGVRSAGGVLSGHVAARLTRLRLSRRDASSAGASADARDRPGRRPTQHGSVSKTDAGATGAMGP